MPVNASWLAFQHTGHCDDRSCLDQTHVETMISMTAWLAGNFVANHPGKQADMQASCADFRLSSLELSLLPVKTQKTASTWTTAFGPYNAQREQ